MMKKIYCLFLSLIFVFCLFSTTFGQVISFVRSSITGPLSLNPTVALANHRMDGVDSAIYLFKVRRITAADEVYIWDINPGTNQVKYTSGGSWTAETDTLVVVTWYDQSGNSHDASLLTEDRQPGLTLNATSNGYPEIDFDGSNDYLSIADADDLSFGNGTTDNPFSVCVYSKPADVTSIDQLYGKRNEYSFVFSAGNAQNYVGDNSSTSSYIGRSGSALAYDGVYSLWSSVYDGDGSTTGIRIYANSTRVDDTDATDGSYAAMHNLSYPVTIGVGWNTSNYYFEGVANGFFLFPSELSVENISALDTYLDAH